MKEELELAVYKRAEELASEIGSDGFTGYTMAVEVNDEIFEFVVDCIVTNYQYEEDTNSASWNVEIFCTNIPVVQDEELQEFILEKFYLETLYKDE